MEETGTKAGERRTGDGGISELRLASLMLPLRIFPHGPCGGREQCPGHESRKGSEIHQLGLKQQMNDDGEVVGMLLKK